MTVRSEQNRSSTFNCARKHPLMKEYNPTQIKILAERSQIHQCFQGAAIYTAINSQSHSWHLNKLKRLERSANSSVAFSFLLAPRLLAGLPRGFTEERGKIRCQCNYSILRSRRFECTAPPPL